MQVELFWVVGQVGILLELSGALYIAVLSVSIHRRMRRLFSNFDGWLELPYLVGEVRKQAKTDIIGFALLAVGLLLQFVGGFGTI